jgi:mycofactocin precursor
MTINVTPIRHAVPKLSRPGNREKFMPDSATELLEPSAEEMTDDSAATEGTEVIAADLLVEEISIDGMCGVY